MARLPILRYPDPRLHIVATPVSAVDDKVRRIVDDMASTMYAADGIGLAATQVDVHRQIIVIDVSERRNQLLVLINPRMVNAGGRAEFEEGCLSVPNVYEKVKRAAWLRLHALDRDGKSFELRADGLLAMCIQHEMDHLRGIVFVEHLSDAAQARIGTALAPRG
jgi:peptide deformylase